MSLSPRKRTGLSGRTDLADSSGTLAQIAPVPRTVGRSLESSVYRACSSATGVMSAGSATVMGTSSAATAARMIVHLDAILDATL